MKHPRSIARIALAILLLAGAIGTARAHDDDLGREPAVASPIDGTWRLVTPSPGEGLEEYKIVSGGRFIWFVVKSGHIVRGAAGRAELQDDVYTERIDSSITADHAWMVGGRGRFAAEFTGDRWRHRGSVRNGARSAEVDEVWERVR